MDNEKNKLYDLVQAAKLKTRRTPRIRSNSPTIKLIEDNRSILKKLNNYTKKTR